MADQNPPPNNDSVNPLFNMMDALMARHRHGPAASLDDIPVLTEVAPKTIPSLFDVVDDIPSLTDVVEPNLADKIAHLELEWAIDHHEPDISHLDDEIIAQKPKAKPQALAIDPLPFQKPNHQAISAPAEPPAPIATAPIKRPIDTITPVPRLPESTTQSPPSRAAQIEPQFLDLPMLDLEELTRAPTPDYLDLPVLQTGNKRDLVTNTPTEHFIATDLVLPLDSIATLEASTVPDFAHALAEASFAANEIPHLDLDAILSSNEPDTRSSLNEEITSEIPLISEAPAEPAVSSDTAPLAASAENEPALTPQSDEDEYYPLQMPEDLSAEAPPSEPIQATPDFQPDAMAAPSNADAPSGHSNNDDTIYDINLDDDDGEIIALSHVDLHLDALGNEDAPSASATKTTEPPLPDTLAESAKPIASHQASYSAPNASPATLVWDDEPELVVYSNTPIEAAAIDLDDDQCATDITPITAADLSAVSTASIERSPISISPEPLPEEPHSPIPNKIDQDAIAEITASVGAQLSLDIASEVEKLAKQHFDAMMAQFYSDALRKLSDQIMDSLEVQLSQRIVDLVEAELRSKGLM